MVELALPLLTALALGTLHAFEPDHMAAVTGFVVRRPRPAAALGFGLRWAAGHGVVVFVAGTALVALGLRVPELATVVLERLVGVGLIALGLWTARTARSLHVHEHAHVDGTRHTHLHAHHGHSHHHHGHAVTAWGALHGLAGTAPVLALLPLTRFDTVAGAALYLCAFGIGTAIGMVLFALATGVVVSSARRSTALARGVLRFTSVATVAVGVLWLVGH